MKPEDFEFISALVKQRSGLVLTKDKAYLLESRLMPLARKRGLKGLEELIAQVRSRKEEPLIKEITEAMTTNESFFFRDIKPFDLFRANVLPELIQSRASKKSFRIWCAAASSGQEPYSIAMILREEAAKLAGWKVEIVGTDISTDILNKAKAGVYTQFEVQRGLPIQLLVKYFKKQDEFWAIDPSIRAMVQYKEYNLLEPLRSLGNFDVVFCRNVLIYFDQPTKAKVLDEIAGLMPDDGVLFLGGAETVLGISDKFKPMAGQRGVYGLTSGGAAPAAGGVRPAAAPSTMPARPGAAPAAAPTRPALGTRPATFTPRPAATPATKPAIGTGAPATPSRPVFTPRPSTTAPSTATPGTNRPTFTPGRFTKPEDPKK